MENIKINAEYLSGELQFSAARSGGPGGQNVNKVNTKVYLRFDIRNSELLNDEQKAIILKKLAERITKEEVLVLSSQNERTQLKNKLAVLEKLNKLLKQAFYKKRIRKATKPTKASKQKRLDNKKKHAEKKKWRQKF